MAVLLHIETATFNGSIAISDGEELIDHCNLGEGEKHIKTLAPTVRAMLESNNLPFSKLEGVVISAGPGSYTGLRIGLAFCKGLCTVLKIPLIAIPTLQVIAEAIFAKHQCDLAIPMLDARRLEVYYAVYDNEHKEVLSARPYILEFNGLKEYDESTVVIAGNAATKARDVLDGDHLQFDESIVLNASHMISIANDKYKSNDFVSLSNFEPTYLKDFLIGKSNKIANILKGS